MKVNIVHLDDQEGTSVLDFPNHTYDAPQQDYKGIAQQKEQFLRFLFFFILITVTLTIFLRYAYPVCLPNGILNLFKRLVVGKERRNSFLSFPGHQDLL